MNHGDESKKCGRGLATAVAIAKENLVIQFR